MRIPLRKIYRAFPELDRFDDDRCERFVLQAMRVAWARRVRRHLLEGAAGVATFGVLLIVGLYGARLGGPRLLSPPLAPLIILTYFPLVVAAPIVVSLVVRDWWLRRAVAARLLSARCPACEYSLLGLRVEGESVLCPECGAVIDLERYGLTPQDLLCDHSAALPVTLS